MSSSKIKRFAWPMLALAAMTSGSYVATSTFHAARDNTAHAAEVAKGEVTKAPSPAAVAPAQDMSAAFRSVHASIKDAVVNINTSKKIQIGRGGRMHPEIPEEMRRFFGPDGIPDLPHGGKIAGTGSGVIVSPDGYILTNNHVVDDSDEITVRLDDGREFKAKPVGRDPKSDLAVVRIDAAGSQLTYAKLGDSDALDVGDWVLAFGSPFGFEQSMTQGIISAKGRSNVNIISSNNPALMGLTYENFLQTDAAINPGNSGGPLVNLKGEVVGINTAIASRTGAYNGIGFAIPSNDVRYIMDSLIKGGKVVRGYMGVGIVDVNIPAVRERVKKDGYTASSGVLVENVQADSPGGKGGLQAGDIITAINGKPVQTMTHLRTLVARTRPGEKISLTVWRDGKTTDLSFPVGEQPDSAIVSAQGEPADTTPATANDALGLKVKPLDATAASKYGLKANGGVVVADVDDSSLAAQASLKPGDVITRVNRKPVTTPEEFAAATKNADLTKGVRLTVRSANGAERLVYLEKE